MPATAAANRKPAPREGLFRSLLRRMGLVRATNQPPVVKGSAGDFHDWLVSKHSLDAARRDRILDHWTPAGRSANGIHYTDSKLVRRRARDLVQNNPMAEAAIDAYTSNTVECGIIPRPAASRDVLSAEDRRKWRDAWDRWCSDEADVTGQQHFYELMGLWLEEVIVAGGSLARLHLMTGGDMRNRRLPLAVDLLPEERFADDIDSMQSQAMQKDADGRTQQVGTRLVRGVEIDTRLGKPRAYWIWREEPDAMFTRFDGYSRIRVPADEAFYAFFKRRANQVRGLSMLTPAIVWIYLAGCYTDNELVASAIKSCWAYMIQTDAESDWPTPADGDPDGPVADCYGNDFEKTEPGMIWRGRPGDSISAVGPNVPGSDSKAWLQMIERSIAISMHLSRSEMFRDTGQSSFSAVRAERAADRKRFTRMQWFVVYHFLRPIWQEFVTQCVLRGVDGFPSPAEFAANRDEFLRTSYGTPGWESVNPLDDARADELCLKNRTKTRAEIIAARGEEAEEVFEQTAAEEDHLAELGLTPQLSTAASYPPSSPPIAGEEPPTDPSEGDADASEA